MANAHDYTVTMMLYVVYLSYAIAAIVAIIGALQIYFKMTTGEGDITKSIMMLVADSIQEYKDRKDIAMLKCQ